MIAYICKVLGNDQKFNVCKDTSEPCGGNAVHAVNLCSRHSVPTQRCLVGLQDRLHFKMF